jgi:hypothetical protein
LQRFVEVLLHGLAGFNSVFRYRSNIAHFGSDVTPQDGAGCGVAGADRAGLRARRGEPGGRRPARNRQRYSRHRRDGLLVSVCSLSRRPCRSFAFASAASRFARSALISPLAMAVASWVAASRTRSSSTSTCRACRWATSRSRNSCKGATICRTAAPSSARVRAAEEGGSRSDATCALGQESTSASGLQ